MSIQVVGLSICTWVLGQYPSGQEKSAIIPLSPTQQKIHSFPLCLMCIYKCRKDGLVSEKRTYNTIGFLWDSSSNTKRKMERRKSSVSFFSFKKSRVNVTRFFFKIYFFYKSFWQFQSYQLQNKTVLFIVHMIVYQYTCLLVNYSQFSAKYICVC